MGALEWIMLYSLLSTGFNIWQSNQLGEANAERDRYKAVAEHCSKDGEAERRNTTIEAGVRAVAETAHQDDFTEFRSRRRVAIQTDSGACANASTGGYSGRVVDDTRRLLEELRSNRVQSQP